jgi:pimeloyl-ACP methyl ester carboxylesterase
MNFELRNFLACLPAGRFPVLCLLLNMVEKEFSYRNINVFYRIIGQGKPVVLIHGFGEDGNVWKNQVDYLSGNFMLIIPDLPGSGRTPAPPELWQMDDHAAMIAALLAFEQISKCIVIGHSMGGYITLAFAEKYAEHLSAFGLFSSTAFADTEEKKATRRKGIAFINEHGAFEFLKTSVPTLFSDQTRRENPGLINQFINGLSNFSPTALVNYYEAMMQRPDRSFVLKNTEVPVLFVLGEFDNAVPVNDGLKQCHLPEKTYIEVLFHSGHMGMLEEPIKSNRIVETFLLDN